jgi:hypothetical protein
MDNNSNNISQMTTEMPENFKNIIIDFINDLMLTFPEYSYLWSKWGSTETTIDEYKELYNYSLSVFPERFFDILYQNEEIFLPDSTINTFFLPNVDFKNLFNCENVSQKTQQTMWKYLQLLLFTVLNSIQNKNNFGETMNLFDGIDENDLQEKLQETIKSMTSFFTDINNINTNEQNNENIDLNENTDSNESSHEKEKKNIFDIPNSEDLHEHLKGLFDGKIGKLAKELAEEIANDMSNFMDDEDTKTIKTTQDVIKILIKNPQKMMNMVKTVGNKLDAKMKSGEITQEELMKEAGDIFGKMKNMGGGQEQFNEMFKNLAKQMGEGKNSKVNLNAISNLMKLNTTKEKMKERLNQRKQKVNVPLQTNNLPQNVAATTAVASEDSKYIIEKTNENTFLFKMKDSTSPNYSFANEKNQIDHIMKDFEDTSSIPKPNKKKVSKKRK